MRPVPMLCAVGAPETHARLRNVNKIQLCQTVSCCSPRWLVSMVGQCSAHALDECRWTCNGKAGPVVPVIRENSSACEQWGCSRRERRHRKRRVSRQRHHSAHHLICFARHVEGAPSILSRVHVPPSPPLLLHPEKKRRMAGLLSSPLRPLKASAQYRTPSFVVHFVGLAFFSVLYSTLTLLTTVPGTAARTILQTTKE